MTELERVAAIAFAPVTIEATNALIVMLETRQFVAKTYIQSGDPEMLDYLGYLNKAIKETLNL